MAGITFGVHGFVSPQTRIRTRAEAQSAEGVIARSFVERMLWGRDAEFCDQCGDEMKASKAYRLSATQAFCSLEHARYDVAG